MNIEWKCYDHAEPTKWDIETNQYECDICRPGWYPTQADFGLGCCKKNKDDDECRNSYSTR
jgi:hypothetical protein